MTEGRQNGVANSALWAAAGDALGFITELTDQQGVRRRAGVNRIESTTTWKRLVGGKFGATVTLPAGCYSDDTQLRLATGRAIRADGRFDVEAFAKVELPVWLSYALGGGVGTKAAAYSLAHQDVTWFSNFFETHSSKYTDAGGNGAAMRIQPHVWASRDLARPTEYLTAVVRNALCTHGHVRGIFGAVFHAFCLAKSLDNGEAPSPDIWNEARTLHSEVVSLIKNDRDLSSFWLPSWEAKSKLQIGEALEWVSREYAENLATLDSMGYESAAANYNRVLEGLGCLADVGRGEGLRTAMAAAWLAWAFRREDPLSMLQVAVNSISSDTDTIATMAGAISGASAKSPPTVELMDREYILAEAHRLFRISRGEKVGNFEYPDLLSWKPPQTQLDAVALENQTIVVAGLGKGVPIGQKYEARKRDGAVWQWLKLDFGQTVLIKQRDILPVRAQDRNVQSSEVQGPFKQIDRLPKPMKQSPLFTAEKVRAVERESVANRLNMDIDALTADAIRGGFDPATIGQQLLAFADQPNSIERAAAYAAIIVKAKRARKPRSGQGDIAQNAP